MEEMSMEQVLGLVLKLEAQAKEIVKEASDRRDALPEDVERRLSEMREKYLAEAEQRISVIRDSEAEALEKELDAVRAEHDEQMKRLECASAAHSAEWAELIFRNVVGDVADVQV